MKIKIIVLVAIAVLSGLVLFLYPRDYNDKEVETDFANMADNGFDIKIARRLGIQYKRSDASYTIHFLANGYQAYLRNPNAFITGADRRWNDAVAEVKKNGEVASDDWYGSSKAEPAGVGQPAADPDSNPQ